MRERVPVSSTTNDASSFIENSSGLPILIGPVTTSGVDMAHEALEQVIYVAEGAALPGDIVSDQLEMRMTKQVFNVPSCSGEKIVDTKDDRPVRQETLT